MSSCLIFFLFGNLYATTNHCSQVKSLLNKQKGIIADVADVIYDHNYFYFAISLRMKYSIPDRCTIKRFHAFLITSKNGINFSLKLGLLFKYLILFSYFYLYFTFIFLMLFVEIDET